MFYKELREIEKLSDLESVRLDNEIQLIASENYYSSNIRRALSSKFGMRYAEGFPNNRYYAGQKYTDLLESKAIELACKLFNADHANVQPNSGCDTNEAVYFAWANPGDTILAMNLSSGGHLSHALPIANMFKVFKSETYGVDEDGIINYLEIEEKLKQFKPSILLIGYSAYSRIPDFEKIVKLRNEFSPETMLMADMAHVAGLIAAKQHPNPLDFGFNVMTTTTHKTLRGNRGGLILSKGIKPTNYNKEPEHKLENLPTLIDRSVFPKSHGGPHMNEIMAKAICFLEALQPEFVEYQKQVIKNAKTLSDELINRGYKIFTNGTDNHLLLIDIKKSIGISGGEAEKKLENIGIICNKNGIPNDDAPKFNPSGIRIGTPAVTTRGMKEEEMKKIAYLIDSCLREIDNEKNLKLEVLKLANEFPILV